jgi:hypothetical protein
MSQVKSQGLLDRWTDLELADTVVSAIVRDFLSKSNQVQLYVRKSKTTMAEKAREETKTRIRSSVLACSWRSCPTTTKLQVCCAYKILARQRRGQNSKLGCSCPNLWCTDEMRHRNHDQVTLLSCTLYSMFFSIPLDRVKSISSLANDGHPPNQHNDHGEPLCPNSRSPTTESTLQSQTRYRRIFNLR